MTGADAASIREHFGLTQQEMGFELGYRSEDMVYRYERKPADMLPEKARNRYLTFTVRMEQAGAA